MRNTRRQRWGKKKREREEAGEKGGEKGKEVDKQHITKGETVRRCTKKGAI